MRTNMCNARRGESSVGQCGRDRSFGGRDSGEQFRLFHECIEWVGEGLSDKGPETRVAMTRALRRIEEMCHGFTVSLDYDPGQSVVYENPDPGEHLIYLCYLVLRRKVLSMKKLM